jgi:nitrogen fixation protein NifB
VLISLPTAGKTNIACAFRAPPSAAVGVLRPAQAAAYLDAALKRLGGSLAAVSVDGPGEPFADADTTLRTLEAVRRSRPEVPLFVSTNGLEVAEHAEALAALGVRRVTVEIHADDAGTAAAIHPWVRLHPRVYQKEEGAALLLDRQADAVRALKRQGLAVRVGTVVIPGINDGRIEGIARLAASLGADDQVCVPFTPIEGTPFAGITPPTEERMTELRRLAEAFIPQAHGEAAAGGLAGEAAGLEEAAAVRATRERPYVAVVSREGLFVNLHLGEADCFWIYGRKDGKAVLVGRRPAPVPGSPERWQVMADTLADCAAILVGACGEAPRRVLDGRDIAVVAVSGALIADTALPILEGSPIAKIFTAPAVKRCSCGGGGGGCG